MEHWCKLWNWSWLAEGKLSDQLPLNLLREKVRHPLRQRLPNLLSILTAMVTTAKTGGSMGAVAATQWLCGLGKFYTRNCLVSRHILSAARQCHLVPKLVFLAKIRCPASLNSWDWLWKKAVLLHSCCGGNNRRSGIQTVAVSAQKCLGISSHFHQVWRVSWMIFPSGNLT